MMPPPETLETYAHIFEMPRRVDGHLMPPTEACLAAARALRFMAVNLGPSPLGVAGFIDDTTPDRPSSP